MIQLTSITLRRRIEPLLEQASATLYPGHRVGLIGANGSGKSSLLALLRGELSSETGETAVPKHWIIAHMAQDLGDLERSALDLVLDGDPGFRDAEREVLRADADGDGTAIGRAHAHYQQVDGYTAHARAATLLSGLGFRASDQQRPAASFSGGWRVRLGLARALMCPSDLLLLDEPTNHLDLEAVLWLEDWLKAYRGTLLLISHDRDFLDAVVDEVLHIEHRKLHQYRGGYSDFERQRAARLAGQQATYEQQQRAVAHMQRFVDRFRAQATKARAAQSRIKALERMTLVAPAQVDNPFRFSFKEPPRAGNPLLSLDSARLGYGAPPILDGITLQLSPGDRIGLLGPNGAGKSTLVRALAGELLPLSGTLDASTNLRIGYFAQHQLEQLDPGASPLEHLARLSPVATEQRRRDFLGGFGFAGDRASSPVAPLSGGEKARLVLALLVWQAPNLLLLDEPTNHLDLEMRAALTLALQDYAGALVVVSHDRHLLATTVDTYWLVSDGAVTVFDGDLTDYRRWLERRARNAAGPAEQGAATDATGRRDQRRRDAARRAELRPLQERASRLAADLDRVGAELAKLEQELADPALYGADARDQLSALLQRQDKLRQRAEQLEAEWIAAEESLAVVQAE
ncbi:MAG: ATP-binding cassette domain-containing protein [Porticoccaceae bacterium]